MPTEAFPNTEELCRPWRVAVEPDDPYPTEYEIHNARGEHIVSVYTLHLNGHAQALQTAQAIVDAINRVPYTHR